VILAHLTHMAFHPATLSFFQEEQQVGFSPLDLWHNMGALVKGVVIVLFIESIWSLAVIIDRYLYFNAAKKQSREFAPRVAGALKEAKLDEAIKVADRNKKSHLAEVVTMAAAAPSPPNRSNPASAPSSGRKRLSTPS
jgi:biopolymer transport protein ExbB/TolQ